MSSSESVLLDCEYFPCIEWYRTLLAHPIATIEQFEYFERTTYRNRAELSGPNGKITLSVPLNHGRNQRRRMKEIQVYDREPWQVLHWKTLCSAYRRSPYFEYYEEKLSVLFEKNYKFLLDCNLEAIHTVNELLGIKQQIILSTEYSKEVAAEVWDARRQFGPKKSLPVDSPHYIQNFGERHGFLPNLSILDMLFSCGPATVSMLVPGDKKTGE